VSTCGYRPEDILVDDIDTDGVELGLNLNPSAEGYLTKLDKPYNTEGLPALPFIVAERDPPAYLI